MRILFLTNHLRGDDGWSRYSLEIIEELQRQGHKVLCLVCQKSTQNKIKERVILKYPLKFLANPWLSVKTARKIDKLIKEFSPEIVHFAVEPYTTILPFLKKNNYKACLTVHGTYANLLILIGNFLKRKISKFLSKRYYQQIDKIITVSNYTRQYLFSNFLEPNGLQEVKNKITVITNGVNLEKHKIIDLDKKPINKTKKILFVGAIKAKKGLLQAIKALRYYKENFSDNFVYNIVGSYDEKDSYFKELTGKIKKYRLENHIFFRGRVSDQELQDYYLNADLFLMLPINIAGKFEGFGLVFLEVNTKGIPCIGSKNFGCLDAIKDSITGYLVDPDNFKKVAEKIDMVLNQNRINSMDCIDWAKQNSMKIKVKELVKVYQGIL